MPVWFGLALNAAMSACGQRSTSCPLTVIRNAMLPIDGAIDTRVSVAVSVS